MASDGDTITYTFSGAKETEDISAIDEITIQRMDGADGADTSTFDGGSGGLIQNATVDVSNHASLEIWVGGVTFGRSDGGAGTFSNDGGGSTELWTDSNSVFIAAADAGGAAATNFSGLSSDRTANPGGGGARGGLGGTDDVYSDAEDAEGTGFGGDGGNVVDGSAVDDAEDGGQELGIASGGTTTTGGSTDGNGEITLSYTGASPPAAPSNLQLSLQ